VKGTVKLDSLQAQRLAAGHTVTSLAKKATVSDWTIVNVESGGNVDVVIAQRIADALAVSLVTLGKRDL
jgi:predicted transcriptional regulator